MYRNHGTRSRRSTGLHKARISAFPPPNLQSVPFCLLLFRPAVGVENAALTKRTEDLCIPSPPPWRHGASGASFRTGFDLRPQDKVRLSGFVHNQTMERERVKLQPHIGFGLIPSHLKSPSGGRGCGVQDLQARRCESTSMPNSPIAFAPPIVPVVNSMKPPP